MSALAGFKGRIIINGTVLRAHRWSIDWKVDDFDVTTFENNTISTWLPGITDFDLSFDAYYDPVDNPFNPVGNLSIIPGTYIGPVILRYNKALATQLWTFPIMLVVSCHNETGVRDTIHYSATLKCANPATANGDGTETSGTGILGIPATV